MELAILSDEISLDLEEAFRYGTEFGFRKYEIRCFDDYDHRIPDFRPGRMERLEELVSDGTIDVTAVTPGTFKIFLSDQERLKKEMEDILPRTCEMAKRLDCDCLIAFGFLRELEYGDDAVIELTAKFDRLELDASGLRFTADEIASHCDAVSDADRAALELAAARIRAYHERQMPQDASCVRKQG